MPQKNTMGCAIAILIDIYLLIFHPFERLLIFGGLWFMGNITLDTLRGYKRVEPAYKSAFKRAMRKHFLLYFTISVIPLVFVMAYLVSFILQQDPHHPLIGYMSIGVSVIFFFSYEHFIAPRIPPKAITATPEVLEILRKLPDKDQIQIEKTPVMPLIAKAFLVTLPFPLGLGIEIFRQGLSLLASSLIALCAQLLTIAITYFVEPYPKPTLRSHQSLDQDSS